MLYHKSYLLHPDAEWVVFIHGAGGSSSIWYKQLKAFKEHFNVLLLDLRGHGRSKEFLQQYLKSSYTFQDVSRDVLQVLDYLQIRAAHFVGISLGCIIIRTIGELQPSRVRSMILAGAITRLDIRSNFLMTFGSAIKRLVPYMWLYSLFAWVIMPRERHRTSRTLFINEAKKLAQKEFLRWYKLTAEVNPLLKYFKEKELPIPALYVMGEEDHLFLPPVKALVAQHRFATLQVLPECGHVVNVDQAELFNQLSVAFIRMQTT